MSTDWEDRLQSIKKSGVRAAKRSAGLSCGPNHTLLLEGEEIPYKHLPTAFECLSAKKVIYTKSGSLRRTTYSIDVGSDRFVFHKFENGDFEYTVDNVLHCSLGPAKKIGNSLEHYKNGALHNERGPAVKNTEYESYFLDGKEVSLTELTERSPHAVHSWGVRGDKSFTISRLNDTAIVRGMDGTVAILSATSRPANIDDVLLEMIGARVPGYRVIAYERTGSSIAPIYSYLRSDTGTWDVSFTSDTANATYVKTDGSRASLRFSKNTNNLAFEIELPNKTTHSSITDFGFNSEQRPPPPPPTARFPHIEIHRNSDEKLHRIDGPAVVIPSTPALEQYFLYGEEVSKAEHTRFDPIAQSIVFENENGDYHRIDGPAIIDFSLHAAPAKYWYAHGERIQALSTSELINLAGNTMSTYTDLNAKQDMRQNKFEEALKRVGTRAEAAKATKFSTGVDGMDIKTVKHGDARASQSDSRIKQVTSGAKLGLQKAALRVGSRKIAEKIVETASPTDNVVIQRIVQLALLLGTAELAERLPDGAASKVGFTEDRREGYGGLARYVAGETLGRDAVDIVGFVAPMLLDKLQGISAEDIAELTAEAESVDHLEAHTTPNSK